MQEQQDKTGRLHALAQRVGFAVWQLQELEAVSAIYVVLRTQATRAMGIAAGEALVKKAQGGTFGRTIAQLDKANLLSQDLAAEFARLLAERNWLVHRSRADSGPAIHGDAAVQLLARIDAIAHDALVLLKKIEGLTLRFMSEQGFSPEDIDRETRRAQQQPAGTHA